MRAFIVTGMLAAAFSLLQAADLAIGWRWAAIAVQTPGTPTLYISNAAPGVVVIAWSPPTPGFVLQASPDLTAPVWEDVPSGTANPATVPLGQPANFFRLTRR